MFRFMLSATILSACTEVGLNPENTRTVTNTVINTVTDTVTSTMPAEDTGTDDTDPCDLTYRSYSDDGNWVDLTVGAMPQVISMFPGTTLSQGSGYVFTNIKVVSKDECGPVEILGVDAVIKRSDGQLFPYTPMVALPNKLTTNAVATAYLDWEAPTNAMFNSNDPSQVYGVWSEWDELGPTSEVGDFYGGEITTETLDFNVVLPVMADLPVGDYVITHTVHWRDPKTGTEVWYDNLDDAEFLLTID